MNCSNAAQRQITRAEYGHILTNTNVWSPDSQWIVYDVRSDPAGDVFDGERIERVHATTGEVQLLYKSQRGAQCGVATCSPADDKVVFIQGPETPAPDWKYSPSHRRGLIVNTSNLKGVLNLDARDIVAPYTPGALRGGTHLHVFDGSGLCVSFTYEDAILSSIAALPGVEQNRRMVGVSFPGHFVRVPSTHPRNHDSDFFSVIVTWVEDNPVPGSDQIGRAFEEAWVGKSGYLCADGSRQGRAIAFQGEVVISSGQQICEVFIVDLPDDVTTASDKPLQGTATLRPRPPRGCVQRRLTRTDKRKYPGVQGPRHWVRSSPDGSRIAFLMKDDTGVVQLHTITPLGGPIHQVTHNAWSIASAFSWARTGQSIAHVMDNSIFITDLKTGRSQRVTPRNSDADAPLPQACVFSPDDKKIAFVRSVKGESGARNQIFIAHV